MTDDPIPKCNPTQTKIGWIGTGVMGQSMCRHLLSAGYRVTVHSRTRSKADGLVSAGAIWADSPKAVAMNSDVVFSIVGMPQDVAEVFLGSDGVLAGCTPGKVVVDMTTSPPELARQIAKAAEQIRVHSIDAPVSGGDIGARNATLSIMVGGNPQVVSALEPCWQAMGKTVVHQGGAGAGQHTKMVNQILIGSNMIGVCEALLYGFRAGLDLTRVLESVSGGAAGSWSLTNLAPRIVANNFAPGFFVDHFVKDLGIAVKEAEQMGIQLPGLQLAQRLYLELQKQGAGQCGTQALQNSLAALSGIDWENRTGNPPQVCQH
jgi:3-hydroxyisobutyrate dehydrogenase